MNSQNMSKKLALTADGVRVGDPEEWARKGTHPGSAAVRQQIDLSVDHRLQSESSVSYQIQNGYERLIATMGIKTTPAKQKYPSWKGEASAVIFGIWKFHTILSYKKYRINTDSSALRHFLCEHQNVCRNWYKICSYSNIVFIICSICFLYIPVYHLYLI